MSGNSTLPAGCNNALCIRTAWHGMAWQDIQCWLGITDRRLVHMCRTNKFFVRKVRAAADSTCKHKVLMAYSPHAPRNRPKQTVSALGTLRHWHSVKQQQNLKHLLYISTHKTVQAIALEALNSHCCVVAVMSHSSWPLGPPGRGAHALIIPKTVLHIGNMSCHTSSTPMPSL